jgi:ubiquinone/menaquinone biosynthesis C-methylase UbiE/uncharacterized protein YbaR (Trm112 family)
MDFVQEENMKKYIVDMLECPVCHHQLDWKIVSQDQDRIEQAEANCSGCEAVYPVRDGIGIFLTPDLSRNDTWEQVDSQVVLYLRDHPDIEKQLMEGPAEKLSPTDQQFRAMVLDERGQFAEGRKTEELANTNLYTSEYLMAWNSQFEYVLESLSTFSSPIVDLASGRCYLVEKIISKLRRPVIATDFSPNVLRRNRKYFQFLGLDDFVSFLAFDARKTPFKEDAVEVITTNIGLANIENPGDLLSELKRIISGTLLAVSHFYPENDDANRKAIKNIGLEAFTFKEAALQYFSESGWSAKFENSYMARALPTPPSVIFEGARADGLPVAATELEWCTLRASPV